jgi:Glycosyl transferase family 2
LSVAGWQAYALHRGWPFLGLWGRVTELLLERNIDFRSAAARLEYGTVAIDKVVRIATQNFGDLRWTNPEEGDGVFLRSLCELRVSLNAGVNYGQGPVTVLGKDCDFLYRIADRFPFTKALNFAALACIPATRPCALVATVRNEGPFLLEWIAYYRAIGLSDIYIYTNDNTDGSTELLAELARHGIIRLILNHTDQIIMAQIKAYEHSLFLLPELRQYQFVFYLDADEFFVPDARYDFNIRNLVAAVNARYQGNLPSCICYNWNWMSSGGAVRRAPGFVTERFPIGSDPADATVKSLVRPPDVLSMKPLHAPSLVASGFAVNSALDPVTVEKSAYVSPVPISSNSSSGKINHYWHKSFEEFLVKQARGSSVSRRETNLFFKWEKREEQKVPRLSPIKFTTGCSEGMRAFVRCREFNN